MLKNCIQNYPKYGQNMDTKFPVKIKVTLQPVFHNDPPKVRITFGNVSELYDLTEKKFFHFFGISDTLKIEFLNKKNEDTIPNLGLDKAVIIENISFYGISHNKFIWAGKYMPNYPEPWYSEQNPKPPVILENTTYLGWNGVWELNFTRPIFTWIHKLLDLGWIHHE